jgi:hypothetical protein
MTRARASLILPLIASLASLPSLSAADEPKARPLTAETADLAIGGMVGAGSAVFMDLAAVMALPARSFACVDPWDGKPHRFTGALLSDLLARAGIDRASTRITVTAKNKYSIPIRRADYEKFGYILAWKLDDALFAADKATRNRGKLIIAIDFAGHPELDPQLYKHQLVWQVNGIVAE